MRTERWRPALIASAGDHRVGSSCAGASISPRRTGFCTL